MLQKSVHFYYKNKILKLLLFIFIEGFTSFFYIYKGTGSHGGNGLKKTVIYRTDIDFHFKKHQLNIIHFVITENKQTIWIKNFVIIINCVIIKFNFKTK